MKSLRYVLSAVLMTLAPVAFAQSDAQKPAMHADAHKSAQTPAPKSEGQKSFETLKGLGGTWSAKLKVDPPLPPEIKTDDLPGQISMRVTSRGNALVHEMYAVGVPDDPTRYDHPVTMFYLDKDSDRLTLVHYCDAGNRPRMVARTSPNGNKVEFDLVDISGGTQKGHMHHAVFTIIDADHHIEDWTYMMPGDKPVLAHFELTRIRTGSGASGK